MIPTTSGRGISSLFRMLRKALSLNLLVSRDGVLNQATQTNLTNRLHSQMGRDLEFFTDDLG
jgi:hypothetical protein